MSKVDSGAHFVALVSVIDKINSGKTAANETLFANKVIELHQKPITPKIGHPKERQRTELGDNHGDKPTPKR